MAERMPSDAVTGGLVSPCLGAACGGVEALRRGHGRPRFALFGCGVWLRGSPQTRSREASFRVVWVRRVAAWKPSDAVTGGLVSRRVESAHDVVDAPAEVIVQLCVLAVEAVVAVG